MLQLRHFAEVVFPPFSGAHEHDELAGLDIEIDRLQRRRGRIAVGERDAAQRDDGGSSVRQAYNSSRPTMIRAMNGPRRRRPARTRPRRIGRKRRDLDAAGRNEVADDEAADRTQY